MSDEEKHHESGYSGTPMALDAVRTAFYWLVTGPAPVAIDGARFAGFPARRVPLDEARERLLDRSCPQQVRDAVWAHLVTRTRAASSPLDGVTPKPKAGVGVGVGVGAAGDGTAAEKATWTVGCAGMALPALTRVAAELTRRLAADPCDIHAALLTGFLAELPVVDLTRPGIMSRLRWAAYRAGMDAVHHALAAPTPRSDPAAPTPLGDRVPSVVPLPPRPPVPGHHPDLVLARAVADGILSTEHAELIGATRIEGLSLAAAARRVGANYQAAMKARQRAEQRLAIYLLAALGDTDLTADPVAAMVAATVAAKVVTTGLSERTPHEVRSHPVTEDGNHQRLLGPTRPSEESGRCEFDAAPDTSAQESRCA